MGIAPTIQKAKIKRQYDILGKEFFFFLAPRLPFNNRKSLKKFLFSTYRIGLLCIITWKHSESIIQFINK